MVGGSSLILGLAEQPFFGLDSTETGYEWTLYVYFTYISGSMALVLVFTTRPRVQVELISNYSCITPIMSFTYCWSNGSLRLIPIEDVESSLDQESPG